jgi:hypothetical protein
VFADYDEDCQYAVRCLHRYWEWQVELNSLIASVGIKDVPQKPIPCADFRIADQSRTWFICDHGYTRQTGAKVSFFSVTNFKLLTQRALCWNFDIITTILN